MAVVVNKHRSQTLFKLGQDFFVYVLDLSGLLCCFIFCGGRLVSSPRIYQAIILIHLRRLEILRLRMQENKLFHSILFFKK